MYGDEALDKHIKISFEKLSLDGTMQAIVDDQVKKGLAEAVESAFNSYEIQNKLQQIIIDSLVEKGSSKRKGK